jgi:hypothetical protein
LEQNKLGILLITFITLLIGIVLVRSLADSTYIATNTYTQANESLAITSGVGQLSQDDVAGISWIGNQTHSATSVLGTSVNWTRAGVVTAGTGYNSSDHYGFNVTYSYENDEYVSNSTARTLIGLLILLFVLAIIAVGMAGFKKLQEGLL